MIGAAVRVCASFVDARPAHIDALVTARRNSRTITQGESRRVDVPAPETGLTRYMYEGPETPGLPAEPSLKGSGLGLAYIAKHGYFAPLACSPVFCSRNIAVP